MADCIPPTPPAAGAPEIDWADYNVAFAAYLACLETGHSSTSISVYASEFAAYQTAVVGWRNHLKTSIVGRRDAA